MKMKQNHSLLKSLQRRNTLKLASDAVKLTLINSVASAYALSRLFGGLFQLMEEAENGLTRLSLWCHKRNTKWFFKEFGATTPSWDYDKLKGLVETKEKAKALKKAKAKAAKQAAKQSQENK